MTFSYIISRVSTRHSGERYKVRLIFKPTSSSKDACKHKRVHRSRPYFRCPLFAIVAYPWEILRQLSGHPDYAQTFQPAKWILRHNAYSADVLHSRLRNYDGTVRELWSDGIPHFPHPFPRSDPVLEYGFHRTRKSTRAINRRHPVGFSSSRDNARNEPRDDEKSPVRVSLGFMQKWRNTEDTTVVYSTFDLFHILHAFSAVSLQCRRHNALSFLESQIRRGWN